MKWQGLVEALTWFLAMPIGFACGGMTPPSKDYVTEDRSAFYVAEDGVTHYVQEN